MVAGRVPFDGTTPNVTCETNADCEGDGVCKRPFYVLSLTTLSTPHNGSVLADIGVSYRAAASKARLVDYVGFEGFTDQLAYLSEETDPAKLRAREDLTTTECGLFNAVNIGALPSDTVFNAVAADADSNGNAAIDSTPDEYAELRAEDLTLAAIHNEVGAFVTRPLIDKLYQILRGTASLTMTVTKRLVGMEMTNVALLIAVPNPTPLGNDTLVTIPSGLGTSSFSNLTTNILTLTGPQARNHSSVANSGVAASVWPWLRSIEQTRGDLR